MMSKEDFFSSLMSLSYARDIDDIDVEVLAEKRLFSKTQESVNAFEDSMINLEDDNENDEDDFENTLVLDAIQLEAPFKSKKNENQSNPEHFILGDSLGITNIAPKCDKSEY